MLNQPATPQAAPWHEIDDLVADLARLGSSGVSESDFYAELLGRCVPALAAVGAALWVRAEDGQLLLAGYQGLDSTDRALLESGSRRHDRLLATVLRSGEPQLVAPHNASDPEAEAKNPTGWLLILAPVMVDEAAVGVLEIVQRPDTTPAAQQGYLRFVAALAELAADFHRRSQARALQSRDAFWAALDDFAVNIHSSLDLKATAFAIANEGRRLLGCDRVSVARREGRRCRLLAVSGASRIDRRATVVRGLERLAAAVAATDEPLWNTEGSDGLAPQIEAALAVHLDAAPARSLAVVPLKSHGAAPQAKSTIIGVLVAEQFEVPCEMAAFRERTLATCRHAEGALARALETESIPFYSLLRPLGGLRRGIRSWGLARIAIFASVVASIAAVGAALALVPADFDVAAKGELMPARRQDVFAPADGVIDQLHARHAAPVAAGDVLAELRRPALDLEFARVLGETETARKRLATLRASRLGESNGEGAPEREQELTAEEEEVKELLESLAQQHSILLDEQKELAVKSPLAGVVTTWNVVELLAARPVRRGQVLLSVADLEGPWVLELHVPEEQIGHVLAAQADGQPAPGVTFILPGQPDVAYEGAIDRVSLAATPDEARGATVLVVVSVDRERIPQRRPGVTAAARIHCGRRALGYVWFHDLWNAVHSRIWW